jgi:hypothetical protein
MIARAIKAGQKSERSSVSCMSRLRESAIVSGVRA